VPPPAQGRPPVSQLHVQTASVSGNASGGEQPVSMTAKELLRLMVQGGPGVCQFAITNACNAHCRF
jgi:hypothetical protein